MTDSRSFFSPVLDGGHGDHHSDVSTPFHEVTNWTVSLLFKLVDCETPVSEERRFRMLRCLVGLSPMLTISKDALALTLATVGTRDQAVARGLEFAWTCLEEGDIRSAQLVGVNVISHDRVDTCMSSGLPFLYDTETARAAAHEDALERIRSVANASELLEAPQRGERQIVAVSHDAIQTASTVSRETTDVTRARSRRGAFSAALFPAFVEHLRAIVIPGEPGADFQGVAQAVLDLVESEIIGADGIVNQKSAADILGVTKQRAHQILRLPAAPSPIAHLCDHPLWLRAQIEALRDKRK